MERDLGEGTVTGLSYRINVVDTIHNAVYFKQCPLELCNVVVFSKHIHPRSL